MQGFKNFKNISVQKIKFRLGSLLDVISNYLPENK
jgi:hypothetical protein